MIRAALMACAFLTAAYVGAAAQTAVGGATVVPNDGSTLYRITEGVFIIEPEQVVDLTDRKLIFSFGPYEKNGEIYIGCRVGSGFLPNCTTGKVIDLKKGCISGSCYNTVWDKKDFKDAERCVIDIIRIDFPKGGKASGMFRLDCF